ncbi:hypothetical protein, partial [Nostoc sp. UCD121]|uniref:hypothetical protein n=1 Tax=Nostoc sp. UCD121 TaxID=2681305 RepID=UPI001C89F62E
EAGEANEEILAFLHTQCPMPNALFLIPISIGHKCLLAASTILILSALVFLVQKFHKQGTNNYQLINHVLSINTYILYG